MVSSGVAALLRRPGFTRYFATVAAVRATGTMFTVAGVLLILERTHDLALAGTVVAASTLPGAISGPFLGGWLDVTGSRRRLLVLDRLVTALSLAGVLLLAGHAPNWVLPVIALAYGATSPLSSGAFSAVLPEIAGPELLGPANACEAASINVAFIAGPALAGLIAGVSGAASAVDVQLFGGLALAVVIASDPTFELRPAHDEESPRSVLHAVREGLAATWRIAPLRWNTVIDCVYVLAWGTLFVGFPAYAVSVGAGAHASGYMWAAISAGSMIGGFLPAKALLTRSPRALIGGCLLGVAASAGAWTLAASLPVALVLVFATGILDGPALVALISIRQRLAPVRLRGQIFTTASSLHAAVLAVGPVAAALIHRALGTTATLLAFVVPMAVAAVLAALTQSDGAQPAVTGAVEDLALGLEAPANRAG